MPKRGKGVYQKKRKSQTHSRQYTNKKTQINRRRNNRAQNQTQKKQADVDLEIYRKNLDELSKVKYKANASEEDLEIYTINDRIIYLLLLKLLVIGTTSSVEMASKYASKHKIDLSCVKKALPSVASQVKKIKTKAIKPDMGCLPPGWYGDSYLPKM